MKEKCVHWKHKTTNRNVHRLVFITGVDKMKSLKPVFLKALIK